MSALVRPVSALVWELRAAWASGRRVALSLDPRCKPERIEGWIDRVAASGAFVIAAGWHVPTERILAIHHPSRLGDSTIEDGERWNGRARRVEVQDTTLWQEAA